MDTVDPTLPPASPPDGEHLHDAGEAPIAEERRRRGLSRRGWWASGVAGVVLVAFVAVGLFWKLPYYLLSPGSVRDTEQYISIEGAPSYPDETGVIDYLTVSVRQGTPFELLGAWIDPAVDVVEEELILGSQTPAENRQLNLQLMADSKDSATYQALRRLGYDIATSGTGAVVAQVLPDGSAAGVLQPGDVVVRIDGEPVSVNRDLVEAVQARSPGTPVALDVEALDGGAPRTVTATLGANPDDPAQGRLGVTSFTRDLSFEFPVDVTIDSGRVGGPSAGLAFTLGILDAMTPESLTGGQRVATTGTMGLDGRVGPVGGVHQKVVAADRAGVDVMLVPAAELEEARRYAGDLRVEPVEDLDDALAVLTTLGGGNAVLPPPSTAPLAG